MVYMVESVTCVVFIALCSVMDLLMWRDIKKTGAILASAVILLLSLSLFSALSVFAYFGVVVMTITTSFRLYCSAMCMINKSTDSATPFKYVCHTDLVIFKGRYTYVNNYIYVYVCVCVNVRN